MTFVVFDRSVGSHSWLILPIGYPLSLALSEGSGRIRRRGFVTF